MQPTMELNELEELVSHLDTRISETEMTSEAQTPSLLLCSFGCGNHSWYWHC
ncbi:hypothetical protein [Actinophytocola gossypii]|uniref:SapB/AmfS family lantipeptide n=1 Tax=Actinophytocola gossypii TaxID=2812003 RepID=A0ABT2J224_9PSEU|nr:hypothetical protein [Actinophytocola gossypii]MCT2581900.1 hypothetical protein [Actinophytocola gossypii]